jgi:hypothetical protein
LPESQVEQRIRDRAYFLWEADGRQNGRSEEYWDRATRIELGWRHTARQILSHTVAKSLITVLFGTIIGFLVGAIYASRYMGFGTVPLIWASIIISSILGLLVVVIPRIQARGLQYTDFEKRAWAINEYRKTLASVAAGLLIIVGFFLTARQIAETFQKDVGDSFTKAVEEIGNSSPDIRIGGIYGFARILQDSPVDQPSIIEILSAFVRQRAPTDAAATRAAGPPPDVMAALLTITRAFNAQNPASSTITSLNLGGVDLSEAELRGLDWPNAYLVKTRFDGSDLSEAVLRNANLQYATFRGTVLRKADLEGADLLGASLRETDLSGANLTSVKNLSASQLTKAIIDHTILPPKVENELKHAAH